jgi:hypothetical protein
MKDGAFCRLLSEHVTSVELTLRSTNFTQRINDESQAVNNIKNIAMSKDIIVAEFTANSLSSRVFKIDSHGEPAMEPVRVNAVCTVQTFRNNQTGEYTHRYFNHLNCCFNSIYFL